MKLIKYFFVAAVLPFCIAMSGGCGGDKKNSNTAASADNPQSMKGTAKSIEDDRLRCEGGKGNRVENLDLNHDNVADVRKVFSAVTKFGIEKEILICREADLNFDGRKDIIRYFSDEGRPLREELDMDFDGKIDLVNYFENGKVIKQEMDTNFDGLVDIWNFYADQKMVRSERDSNKDGTPDVWEHYSDGELKRIGYDLDGDGKVDRWERSGEEEEAGGKPESKEGEGGEEEEGGESSEE